MDDNDELSPEWQEEINRRVQSIEDGTAVLHELNDVIADLKQEFA
ncbi:MAG: addiction module protein [Lentisphaeraceae bacterium]|nr:addiction module protein [Lentisphaeraceae bacterium]